MCQPPEALGAVDDGEAFHHCPHRNLGLALGASYGSEDFACHVEHVGVGRAPPAVGSSSRLGQGERWTEPSCHHDHTSSVTKARKGASRRRRTDNASAERGACRRGARVGGVLVGARLDELDVVVAERPEERFGAFQRAGVVIGVEGGGGFGDHLTQARQHGQVERRR